MGSAYILDAWFTDCVRWLPMPGGGEREAALTADYNAEMVAQIARYPRIRYRALFVGEPDGIVVGTLGPALPEAIADEVGRDVDYVRVDTGGAARAAGLIAELL